MAIRDFTSYSRGFLKLIPSGKPVTASEPGSFRNLSYGKGTTLLFPMASPGEGTELHTDRHPVPLTMAELGWRGKTKSKKYQQNH